MKGLFATCILKSGYGLLTVPGHVVLFTEDENNCVEEVVTDLKSEIIPVSSGISLAVLSPVKKVIEVYDANTTYGDLQFLKL